MRFETAFVLPLILAAAACGSNEPAAPAAEATATAEAGIDTTPRRAVATVRTADGKDVGTATLIPAGEGMRLALQVSGLPTGDHGVHIHAVGKCEGPRFESAGAHWNPRDKLHGLENPQGPHAGDMPNLTVGEGGNGIVNATLPGTNVAALFDEDGAAVVVHAKEDDQKTDPTGDSGDRIGCGVLG
jgi:Cu-Zn family superoxide dismutase